MIEDRTFKNDFAAELNGFAEDEVKGFNAIFWRFKIYLDFLVNHIEETNAKTRKELKEEDPDVAASMKKQPDIDASLNHFSSMLYESLIISLYSHLESQVKRIKKICETNNEWKSSTKQIANSKLGNSPLEQDVKGIVNWVIGSPLTESTFPKLFELVEWNKVRNHLVHKEKGKSAIDQSFLEDNHITLVNNQLLFESKTGMESFNSLIQEFLSQIIDEINTKHGLISTKQFGGNCDSIKST